MSPVAPEAALRCPMCRRAVVVTADLPFCSPRCRDRDLLNWLGDGYALPGPADEALDIADAQD